MCVGLLHADAVDLVLGLHGALDQLGRVGCACTTEFFATNEILDWDEESWDGELATLPVQLQALVARMKLLQTSAGLKWCDCPDFPAPFRLRAIIKALHSVLVQFPDRRAPFVYTSFCSGKLLQDYIMVMMLVALGYQHVIVNIIDLDYKGVQGKLNIHGFEDNRSENIFRDVNVWARKSFVLALQRCPFVHVYGFESIYQYIEYAKAHVQPSVSLMMLIDCGGVFELWSDAPEAVDYDKIAQEDPPAFDLFLAYWKSRMQDPVKLAAKIQERKTQWVKECMDKKEAIIQSHLAPTAYQNNVLLIRAQPYSARLLGGIMLPWLGGDPIIYDRLEIVDNERKSIISRICAAGVQSNACDLLRQQASGVTSMQHLIQKFDAARYRGDRLALRTDPFLGLFDAAAALLNPKGIMIWTDFNSKTVHRIVLNGDKNVTQQVSVEWRNFLNERKLK